MKAQKSLPEGYKEIYSIDLKKDKKMYLLVNLTAAVIAVLMTVTMSFFVPITALFSMDGGIGNYSLRFIVLFLLMIVYILLHELVHGIAMKLCGTKKVKYGFTGVYAFAGSDDYYGKRAYIFITLAPVVLWGAVLAVINPLVPTEWFWCVYFVQVFNVSGAAGDFIVTARFSGLPKDVLIKDHGVGMTAYNKTDNLS